MSCEKPSTSADHATEDIAQENLMGSCFDGGPLCAKLQCAAPRRGGLEGYLHGSHVHAFDKPVHQACLTLSASSSSTASIDAPG